MSAVALNLPLVTHFVSIPGSSSPLHLFPLWFCPVRQLLFVEFDNPQIFSLFLHANVKKHLDRLLNPIDESFPGHIIRETNADGSLRRLSLSVFAFVQFFVVQLQDYPVDQLDDAVAGESAPTTELVSSSTASMVSLPSRSATAPLDIAAGERRRQRQNKCHIRHPSLFLLRQLLKKLHFEGRFSDSLRHFSFLSGQPGPRRGMTEFIAISLLHLVCSVRDTRFRCLIWFQPCAMERAHTESSVTPRRFTLLLLVQPREYPPFALSTGLLRQTGRRRIVHCSTWSKETGLTFLS